MSEVTANIYTMNNFSLNFIFHHIFESKFTVKFQYFDQKSVPT